MSKHTDVGFWKMKIGWFYEKVNLIVVLIKKIWVMGVIFEYKQLKKYNTSANFSKYNNSDMENDLVS